VNLKFWEWFQGWKKTNKHADPTDLKTLEEYNKAMGVQRNPLEKIDRHNVTDGGVVKHEVGSPDLGVDDAETLKRKLLYGIHQSKMAGPDTINFMGVRAICEDGVTATIVGKVDKSKLYELGYDIREENEAFVSNLGLESQTSVNKDVPEEEQLQQEGVQISRYSGKPQDRPWEMRPNPVLSEEDIEREKQSINQYMAPTAVLVVPEEEVKARIAALLEKAKDHIPTCDLNTHYTEHVSEQGDEFDCWHMCTCKKENNGDDQGNAVPV